jgi:hypothetical protein
MIEAHRPARLEEPQDPTPVSLPLDQSMDAPAIILMLIEHHLHLLPHRPRRLGGDVLTAPQAGGVVGNQLFRYPPDARGLWGWPTCRGERAPVVEVS